MEFLPSRDEPTRTRDRRLGERYPTGPLPIRWNVTRRPLRRERAEDAELVELSLTGAGVIAPPSDHLMPRSRVDVDWDGARATVVIRRIEPGPVPGRSYYGVSFQSVDDAFTERVAAEIARHRPDSIEALRPTDG